jgi:hypothetical protein
MDMSLKRAFLDRWPQYFGDAELPLVFYYTDDRGDIEPARRPHGWACVMGQLAAVRKGQDRCFNAGNLGCGGGRTYLGFGESLRPNFNHFLSCGIPGEVEGERYKKSPEIVAELMRRSPKFDAPGAWLAARRFDRLEATDSPQVVVFLATPDVLSGLFTLAGFQEVETHATLAPFSAGCGSIVKYPFLELAAGTDRPVIGMFDVSARPYVPAHTLSLAIPWPRFERMVRDMDESFLITESWNKVQERLPQGGPTS